MHSIDYTYEENNRTLDVEIQYSLVLYSPAKLTADPYYSSPADGGYCEDFNFKVTSATIYNDEGNVVKDTFTKTELQQFTKEFEKIFEDDVRLQKCIIEQCVII